MHWTFLSLRHQHVNVSNYQTSSSSSEVQARAVLLDLVFVAITRRRDKAGGANRCFLDLFRTFRFRNKEKTFLNSALLVLYLQYDKNVGRT